MYRISYFDLNDGKRKYYMRAGFETIEIADEEFDRIKKESKTCKRLFGRTKWTNRQDWALSEFKNKESVFIKYYIL